MSKLSFGELLRSERRKKGLTMRELERRTGISQAYISQLESGKRNAPKPDMIKKLSDGIDVSYLYLLEKTGYFEGFIEEIEKAFEEIFQEAGYSWQSIEKTTDGNQ